MDRIPYGIIYMTSRVFRGEVVKRYIGQHRIYGGVVEDGYIGSGKLLTQAIKKHGRECFSREVLEVCYSQKELDLAEIKWIDLYNAVENPHFYNLISGGRAGAGETLRKEVHQYTLDGEFVVTHESISVASSVAGCSEAQMTLTCNSDRRTACGFQWRFLKAERVGSVKEGVTRSVCCYDESGAKVETFSSLTKAASFIGERVTGNIASCCKRKKRSAGGYQWRYEEENFDKVPPLKARGTTGRKVYQHDLKTLKVIGVFDSQKEAALHVGGHAANISRSTLQGFAAYGYLWSNE